ncbi:prenyltransferase [Halorubellus salinus]|uniref:prenyltransferase n=1 Tax=Halorubellus salinus TaxID=755309 RepID=UPI001D06CA16|nr:prenyltransferase [Halorubellus salinus]
MTAEGTHESTTTAVFEGVAYLFTLSRPRFWFYLAGPVVVGVAYGAREVPELFAPVAIALFAYFLVPANVYLYGINDVFDRDVDVENPKKEGREARFSGDAWVVAVVAVSGLALVPVAALTPAVAWPYLAAYAVLATEYSAPPLRFKTTPFLDSLSNGLYILPGAAAYAAVLGEHPPVLALAGAWLWTMAMHTFSAIPDIGPDRAAGIDTTATRLGESRTYAYCFAVWAAAALAFAAVDYRLGVVLAVYPVFVAWVARSSVAVDRAYWWFPYLNTVVGMVLTLGALWRLTNGV